MATETTEHSFLGIPIVGEINAGPRATKQRPIEELAPLLQAVLDDPGIEAFGWRQYTPYFNDGEACVFSVGEVWFLTPEDADDEEDQKLRKHDPYGWENAHGRFGEKGFAEMINKWSYDEKGRGSNAKVSNPRFDQGRHDRCQELSAAFYSDQFDTALLAKFGDHARVTITRDSIEVEFYDHE